jgi:uncharacterized protein (TIGR00255 family)
MRSMTAYAQGSFLTENLRFSLELKSYNNRFLEIFISLPPTLSPMEPRIRAFLQERIARGKVECSLRVREYLTEGKVRLDKAAAKAAIDALSSLSGLLGSVDGPRLSDLLAIEGVLGFERELDADSVWPEVERALSEVHASYDREREREGAHLLSDMRLQLDVISRGRDELAVAAPELEAILTENMRKRIREAVGDGIDENRILQETAIALTRFTVNEELARLASHAQAMGSELDGKSGTGKRIDFLCQEINREVNTLGSKNQLPKMGSWIVAMKEAIENIREQARNVE